MDQRTHTCNVLRLTDVDTTVCLQGWAHKIRNFGPLAFIDLRDMHGMTQIVINTETMPHLKTVLNTLKLESVLSIEGTVAKRTESNPHISTGEIEILATNVTVISASSPLPFSVFEKEEPNEELGLKYRYLHLRKGKLINNLQKRSHIMHTIRNFLIEQNFLEVNTPLLYKSTPEGAREFIVPSRIHPSSFYSLPQSPQVFKQLLIIGGIERYFQLATCFRDEDLRADRQPEFMQVDIELAFSTQKTLFTLIEQLLCTIFEVKHRPFLQMTYKEALEHYGTDKPDLRYEMPLVRLDSLLSQTSCSIFAQALQEGGCIKALCIPEGSTYSRKKFEALAAFVAPFGLKGLAWGKVEDGLLSSGISKLLSPKEQEHIIAKLKAKSGDAIVFAASEEATVNQSLDHLRRFLATELKLTDPKKRAFVWITNFPLFDWDKEEGKYKSMHHPFTQPHSKHIPLLETNPLEVDSSSYDVVLNGSEIGGGSQRIHDPQLQKKIFSLLNLSPQEVEQRFGFFNQALQFGTPPHLGIALGLDRIMMILLETESIKDVIAFPKNHKAFDMMCGSPSPLAPVQLKENHIDLLEN